MNVINMQISWIACLKHFSKFIAESSSMEALQEQVRQTSLNGGPDIRPCHNLYVGLKPEIFNYFSFVGS